MEKLSVVVVGVGDMEIDVYVRLDSLSRARCRYFFAGIAARFYISVG